MPIDVFFLAYVVLVQDHTFHQLESMLLLFSMNQTYGYDQLEGHEQQGMFSLVLSESVVPIDQQELYMIDVVFR